MIEAENKFQGLVVNLSIRAELEMFFELESICLSALEIRFKDLQGRPPSWITNHIMSHSSSLSLLIDKKMSPIQIMNALVKKLQEFKNLKSIILNIPNSKDLGFIFQKFQTLDNLTINLQQVKKQAPQDEMQISQMIELNSISILSISKNFKLTKFKLYEELMSLNQLKQLVELKLECLNYTEDLSPFVSFMKSCKIRRFILKLQYAGNPDLKVFDLNRTKNNYTSVKAKLPNFFHSSIEEISIQIGCKLTGNISSFEHSIKGIHFFLKIKDLRYFSLDIETNFNDYFVLKGADKLSNLKLHIRNPQNLSPLKCPEQNLNLESLSLLIENPAKRNSLSIGEFEFFGNLVNLKHLELNIKTDIYPDDILDRVAKLKRLETLVLDLYQISEPQLFTRISQISSLKRLKINVLRVYAWDITPYLCFSQLKELQVFHLKQHSLIILDEELATYIDILEQFQPDKITDLNITLQSYGRFFKSQQSIFRLKNLISLELCILECYQYPVILNFEGVQQLSHLKQFRLKLQLQREKFSYDEIKSICFLTNLQLLQLNISTNKIEGELIGLNKLTSLKSLQFKLSTTFEATPIVIA